MKTIKNATHYTVSQGSFVKTLTLVTVYSIKFSRALYYTKHSKFFRPKTKLSDKLSVSDIDNYQKCHLLHL